ncbi:S-formylglutathione hydrolase [Vannielia litorea]|uniref:S-formylglutathione hydrolase n=1 Tax=Vannielia litorea TaxID=1217970 RepID=UPI001C9787C8|nr:S-formylglutathione hydrolase [Vannielia litorea]MBY6047215.1 S-formylglutathione hydrolase [Vannielia litorea]MBY6074629.1 S-formylglutathione hydrolase [Vannielia litorea]
MSLEVISETACFSGRQIVAKHPSNACGCEMTFAVYLPPQAEHGPVPVLWYLSGLTCTHENAMTKGGFQEHAAEHGIAVIFPDTSPRGEDVADDEAYDLGQGAGFYVNATREPWSPHFRMYDYITGELRGLVMEHFPLEDRHGITGHSMGGHGALTIAMRNAEMFESLSAFAPIANPTSSDWGRKQLSAYLGDDESSWADHDASILLEEKGWKGEILVDQGASDQFLDLLRPEALAQAMVKRRQPGAIRMQPGYDHSYFFVTTFARDHVAWHAERLCG